MQRIQHKMRKYRTYNPKTKKVCQTQNIMWIDWKRQSSQHDESLFNQIPKITKDKLRIVRFACYSVRKIQIIPISASDHGLIITLVYMCHPVFKHFTFFSNSPGPRLDFLTFFQLWPFLDLFTHPVLVLTLFSVFSTIYLFFHTSLSSFRLKLL